MNKAKEKDRKGKTRSLDVGRFIDGESSRSYRRDAERYHRDSQEISSNIDELEGEGEDLSEEDGESIGESDTDESGHYRNPKASTPTIKRYENISIPSSQIESDDGESEEDSSVSRYLNRTITQTRNDKRKAPPVSKSRLSIRGNKKHIMRMEEESSGEDIGSTSEEETEMSSAEDQDRSREESSLLSDSTRNRGSRSVSVDRPRKRRLVRDERSSSPDALPVYKVIVTQRRKLQNWRQMAAEERLLLTQRGGVVWQAAKPLLAEMDEDQKGSTARMLRAIMRSLDERLTKTPVPPTEKMPKDITENPEESSLRSRPMTGSLMSWIAETGGRVDRAEDDPDRTLVDDVPKGFSADIALLEAALIPEVDEVVNLMGTLEEQDRNLEEANDLLDEIKANANNVDEEAKERTRDVMDALRDSLRKIERMDDEAPLTKAENFSICESAKELIK